jgi:hypothetical protein
MAERSQNKAIPLPSGLRWTPIVGQILGLNKVGSGPRDPHRSRAAACASSLIGFRLVFPFCFLARKKSRACRGRRRLPRGPVIETRAARRPGILSRPGSSALVSGPRRGSLSARALRFSTSAVDGELFSAVGRTRPPACGNPRLGELARANKSENTPPEALRPPSHRRSPAGTLPRT